MPSTDFCFVIMPFREKFNEYYSEIIKPLVESLQFSCIRADEIYGPNIIIKDVFEKIENARFLIADVTGKNPNVNYELGIAHALNKPVIIISQSIDDIPFDYKHLRICLYQTDKVHWAKLLETDLRKSISSAISNPSQSIIHHFKNDLLTDQLKVITHFKEIYYQYDYSMIQENVYEIVDETKSIITRKYTIFPNCSMFHYFQMFRIDKPGNFKIVDLEDPTSNNKLNHIVASLTDTEFSFYILTKYLEVTGKSFMIEMTLEIDNYFCNLFSNKEEFIGGMSLNKSLAKYLSITETIIFPATPKFKNLKAKIKNHPDLKLVDKVIPIKKVKNQFILTQNFSNANSEPFRNSIGFSVHL